MVFVKKRIGESSVMLTEFGTVVAQLQSVTGRAAGAGWMADGIGSRMRERAWSF